MTPEIIHLLSQGGICIFLILYLWWQVMPLLTRMNDHLETLETLFMVLAPKDTTDLLKEIALLRNQTVTKR